MTDIIQTQDRPQIGVGTELKLLLARLWIRSTPECKCDQRAELMDLQGPAWCWEQRETVVRWMQEEAACRSIPFSRYAALALLRIAIFRYRKKESYLR